MVNRYMAVLLLVALAGGGGAWWWLDDYLFAPLDVPADGYVLDVVRGSSLTGVTDELANAGLLRYPQVLAWYGRATGQAARIQAGEYTLTQDATPSSVLNQLVEGRVTLHALTILEGWTVPDLLAALGRHAAIRQTLNIETAEELARALELDYPHAEGWFFPDTYHFPRGTTDVELLNTAHTLMVEQLADAWAGRAIGTGLNSPYEVLILASIVERESALQSERPQIAGVFSRRLSRGMRLQTDPTVIYGIGPAFDGNLTRRHLGTDTPYNTYMRKGLPPTPIALPSESALRAAVNPDSGNALYFVATGRDDGSHTFTATLEEHNAAVARYLAALRQRKHQQTLDGTP